jgi:hypothetical protein
MAITETMMAGTGHKDQILADGIGVVQFDDGELACRLAEQAFGKTRPFSMSDEDRQFFLGLAAAAVDYFEERAEAAGVHYA